MFPFFFFNDTATTEIYTLSLHDALPIIGLKGGGHQHSAADLRLDVEAVADFQVVEHPFENFVDFPRRGHQTKPLQTFDDVIFRLASPGAFRLQRRIVVGVFRLIRYRSFDEYSTQLLLFGNAAQRVAPEPRLCPKGRKYLLLRHGVLDITFFTEDDGRQPLVFSSILAPAVKAEVVAERCRAVVDAIETHNVEVLILDPDAPYEASLF